MEGRQEEGKNQGGESVDSYPVNLEELMKLAVECQASDLHLAGDGPHGQDQR